MRAAVSAGGFVELGVELVGDVFVVEWQGVGVVAEGCGGVAVAEACLGFQQVPCGDEPCADAVAEAVQGGVGHAGSVSESFEPVGEQVGAGVGQAAVIGSEDPVPYDFLGSGSAFPGSEVSVDHGGRGGADGQAPVSAGLGRAEDLERQVPLDGEHSAVEVAETDDGELTAAGAGVGGEPDEEKGLFGHEQPLDQSTIGRFGP